MFEQIIERVSHTWMHANMMEVSGPLPWYPPGVVEVPMADEQEKPGSKRRKWIIGGGLTAAIALVVSIEQAVAGVGPSEDSICRATGHLCLDAGRASASVSAPAPGPTDRAQPRVTTAPATAATAAATVIAADSVRLGAAFTVTIVAYGVPPATPVEIDLRLDGVFADTALTTLGDGRYTFTVRPDSAGTVTDCDQCAPGTVNLGRGVHTVGIEIPDVATAETHISVS
jgi:hypothetical protein